MSYDHRMPYKSPEWAPGAEDALEHLVVKFEHKQDAIAKFDESLAAHVRQVRSRGVTLQQIADRLGVSRETVRKMGAAK